MTLKVEVTENGVLRVKSAELKPGDEIILETSETGVQNADKGQWQDIKKALEEFDKLDFPRLNHEELMRRIHDLRG